MIETKSGGKHTHREVVCVYVMTIKMVEMMFYDRYIIYNTYIQCDSSVISIIRLMSLSDCLGWLCSLYICTTSIYHKITVLGG